MLLKYTGTEVRRLSNIIQGTCIIVLLQDARQRISQLNCTILDWNSGHISSLFIQHMQTLLTSHISATKNFSPGDFYVMVSEMPLSPFRVAFEFNFSKKSNFVPGSTATFYIKQRFKLLLPACIHSFKKINFYFTYFF